MTSNEIVDRLPAAAVRYVRQLDAGNLREPLSHKVLLTACSSPEHIVQARLLLREGDELSDRIDPEGRMYCEHNRQARNVDDRHKGSIRSLSSSPSRSNSRA